MKVPRRKFDRSTITKRAHEIYSQGWSWSDSMKRAWREAKGQSVTLPRQGGRLPTVIELVTREEIVPTRQGSKTVDFRLHHGGRFLLSWPKSGSHYGNARLGVDEGRLVA